MMDLQRHKQDIATKQLLRLRAHCQDMAREASSDEWSKDVAALDVAIRALGKKEFRPGGNYE